jgi:hypothetical protein
VPPQRMAKLRALIADKLETDPAKLTALGTEVFWHLYPQKYVRP